MSAKLFDIFFTLYLDSPKSLTSDKIVPKVLSVSFYEKYQLRRLYVETDAGTVYYDLRMKRWGTKDADMNVIDMERVEQNAWKLTGSSCQKEFEKVRGKVTA